jgi:hypothetical protein
MPETKERPILFSAPMVRAILEGRKTVTRREVKKPAALDYLAAGFEPAFLALPGNADLCPYGKPGDRLWVRETCFINDFREGGVPEADRADCQIIYRADGMPDWEGEEELIRWRPSIHMPRWASRILLEITAVRVERLQDISEEQAIAEGILHEDDMWRGAPGLPSFPSPIAAFAHLWISINGVEGWNANPWVWAVEFKRVMP